jgi:hypothetical protein
VHPAMNRSLSPVLSLPPQCAVLFARGEMFFQHYSESTLNLCSRPTGEGKAGLAWGASLSHANHSFVTVPRNSCLRMGSAVFEVVRACCLAPRLQVHLVTSLPQFLAKGICAITAQSVRQMLFRKIPTLSLRLNDNPPRFSLAFVWSHLSDLGRSRHAISRLWKHLGRHPCPGQGSLQPQVVATLVSS